MKRNYHVIGACSCWGAQLRACEMGPRDLIEGQVFERLQHKGISLSEIQMLFPKYRSSEKEIPLANSLSLIHDFNLQLAESVKETIQKGSFPIVVGGDHTNAVGVWNAVQKPLGLLWIDAHMDSHTMETSHSGAYHGMPLAALLGYGLPELAQLLAKTPVLKPENLALIGIRSYEPEEHAFLKKLQVKVYFMEEVQKRGVQEVLREAVAHVTKHCPRFGVSLDLDAFSLRDAPGVGSPVPNGIHADEFVRCLPEVGSDPRLAAFEIVEFNPARDEGHKTRELVYKVLQAVME